MLKGLKPFMVPNLGSHSDCLDYCFFKVTVFNRSYEQLSHKILFYIQCSRIKHVQHKMRKSFKLFLQGKIKTEQNVALFSFFWSKESTVLRYVSNSNSVQPFPPPCFVQENMLVASKEKVVQLHSVSAFCIRALLFLFCFFFFF